MATNKRLTRFEGVAGIGKSEWLHAGDNNKRLIWFWLNCSPSFSVHYYAYGYPAIDAKIVNVMGIYSISIRFVKGAHSRVCPKVVGHGQSWSLVLTYPVSAFSNVYQMIAKGNPITIRVGVKPAASERLLHATEKVVIKGEQAYVELVS